MSPRELQRSRRQEDERGGRHPITFISTVPWGANITSAGGKSGTAWYNGGNYVVIQAFSFSGISEIGIDDEASYTQIIGNHVYNNQNGLYGSNGGAGIDVENILHPEPPESALGT